MEANQTAISALLAAKGSGAGAPPADDQMMMPMGSDKATGELFLDRKLAIAPVKAGQEITVRGTVSSVGSKIGFKPSEIVGEEAEQESEYDPDMDDELGSGPSDKGGLV